MGETKKTKELFLLCMSGVYLVAFSSLFIQIPGTSCNLNVPTGTFVGTIHLNIHMDTSI